jgi:hypothetical protein
MQFRARTFLLFRRIPRNRQSLETGSVGSRVAHTFVQRTNKAREAAWIESYPTIAECQLAQPPQRRGCDVVVVAVAEEETRDPPSFDPAESTDLQHT